MAAGLDLEAVATRIHSEALRGLNEMQDSKWAPANGKSRCKLKKES